MPFRPQSPKSIARHMEAIAKDRSTQHWEWALFALGPYMPPEVWAKYKPSSVQATSVEATIPNLTVAIHRLIRKGWEAVVDHNVVPARRAAFQAAQLCWLGHDINTMVFCLEDRNWDKFGAPIFRRLSDEFSFPNPPDTMRIHRMVEGEPCTNDCTRGCL